MTPEEKPTEVRCECCGSYVHFEPGRNDMDGSPYMRMECDCEVHITIGTPTNWMPAAEYDRSTTEHAQVCPQEKPCGADTGCECRGT